jgi:hypothetical protein
MVLSLVSEWSRLDSFDDGLLQLVKRLIWFLIMRMFDDMACRFTFGLSLYDSYFVLLGSLKVT